MSLFSLLGQGSNTIAAQTAGVAVAGNNAANADSVGYSRQRLDLRAEVGHPLVGGVRAESAFRYESLLLSGRMRQSGGTLAMSEALAGALSSLEVGMTTPLADVGEATTRFFGDLSTLSASPLDPFRRTAVVDSAQSVADAMGRQAQALEDSRTESDQRVRERVGEVSTLAQTIAEANRAASVSNDPVVLDQRDLAAQRLAELVGGTARIGADGHMRFVLPDGGVLVDGTRAASLEARSDSARGGMARIELVDGTHRHEITDNLRLGAIGGDLTFRDEDSIQTAAGLDQLAFDFATQVNAVHRGNAGIDGVSGRDLFVEPATVAGAAASMALDPAITASPDALATAVVGAGSADNTGALALLDMRDQTLAVGGTRTFTDASIDLVSDVGRNIATVTAEAQVLRTTQDHLSGLRDSIAGVSIQEELTRLSEFQHGVEAATSFVRTIDSLLGDIIDML